eukprot:383380-Rhodomonas_salina.3
MSPTASTMPPVATNPQSLRKLPTRMCHTMYVTLDRKPSFGETFSTPLCRPPSPPPYRHSQSDGFSISSPKPADAALFDDFFVWFARRESLGRVQ